MPGSLSISAFSSASLSASAPSRAAARAPASLALRPSSAFSSGVASLKRALSAFRSARRPSISVLSARTSASSASRASRSRSTPLTAIARATVSRFALTKSIPSMAAQVRESAAQGKLVEVQPAIAPAEVQQRIEAAIEARLHDLPNEDVVVAAVIYCEALAFEYTERILEDRRTGLSARPWSHSEAVLVPGRKPNRRGLLTGLEHVDREMRYADQCRGARRQLVHAHQEQRGLEGDRGEAVDGETRRSAGGIDAGDDGD